MEIDNLMKHLQEFENVAKEFNPNSRSPLYGYNRSVEYVKKTLEDAGYKVDVQFFTIQLTQNLVPSTLNQVSPFGTTTYIPDTDFIDMGGFVGNATVTANIYVGGNSSSSFFFFFSFVSTAARELGCTENDYNSTESTGKIAVVSRGNCTFVEKIAAAHQSGALAILIYNYQGGEPFRGNAGVAPIPGIFCSFVLFLFRFLFCLMALFQHFPSHMLWEKFWFKPRLLALKSH